VDEARFPTVGAYLARLPHGIDSFPACKAKGSLVRAMLLDNRIRGVRGALPDAIAELVEDPPPAAIWIPQVHARCVLRALFDEAFEGDEDKLARWAYFSQRKLFSGSIYKILFWGLGPDRLMKLASSRFAHFHVGVELELVDDGRQKVVVLRYPMGVIDALDHGGTIGGMKAALELAGAMDVQAEVLETGTTRARIGFRWS
jgi:hypothetical protein